MKKAILPIIICSLVLSCSDASHEPQKKPTEDSTTTSQSSYLKESKQPDDLATRILGVWAAEDTPNASFEIEKQKITYPETFTSYPYTLTGDSISIHYDDFVGTFAIVMKGSDTLILTGDERQVYHRFKN